MNAQLEFLTRDTATPVTIVGPIDHDPPLSRIAAELRGARADLALDLLRLDWRDARQRVQDANAAQNRAQVAYDVAAQLWGASRSDAAYREFTKRREFMRLTDTLIEHARRDYDAVLKAYVAAGGNPYEGCRDPSLADWAKDLDHRIRD